MTISLNQNQFAQSAMKGNIAAIVNPVTLSCQIDPASSHTVANATPIVAGDAVYLSTAAGNTILVDKAAVTDTPLGFVIHSPKKDKFYAGDAIEVALPGSVIFLESSDTIARGATLEYVVGSSTTASTVKTSLGTNPLCGVALDKATTGTLLRVLVQTAVSVTSSFTYMLLGKQALNSATATVSFTPVSGVIGTMTPTMNATISASAVTSGLPFTLVVTTSGTDAFVLTFNSTQFRTTGTLNTGTANAKVLVMSFISDGTKFNEISRTTAMTA